MSTSPGGDPYGSQQQPPLNPYQFPSAPTPEPEPQYRQMRQVIDQLDVRRAQLYVESLVVEVDASRALDVGLQWKTLFNIGETSLTDIVSEIAAEATASEGTPETS